MNRNINEYKALVFDLDGTLYYQRQLRIKMAWRLLGYYLCHFWRLKDLLVIKRFREIREHWDEIADGVTEVTAAGRSGSLEDEQYAYVAKQMNCTYDRVKQTIETWMYERPLKTVYETRDGELIDHIREIKKTGKKIIIFSDYPIEDKIRALELSVDGMYAATDERLNELKPSPKGLKLIMEDFGLKPSDILMIGDRMVKDGQAAVNAGCDHLILPPSRSGRRKIYMELFISE